MGRAGEGEGSATAGVGQQQVVPAGLVGEHGKLGNVEGGFPWQGGQLAGLPGSVAHGVDGGLTCMLADAWLPAPSASDSSSDSNSVVVV
jgi:hypothetical protein